MLISRHFTRKIDAICMSIYLEKCIYLLNIYGQRHLCSMTVVVSIFYLIILRHFPEEFPDCEKMVPCLTSTQLGQHFWLIFNLNCMSFLSTSHNSNWRVGGGKVYKFKTKKKGEDCLSGMKNKRNLKSIFMKLWLIDLWPNDYKTSVWNIYSNLLALTKKN